MDGDSLARALQSGIHRVISEQETLNRINVFPVADGDTGTNLTLSLGAALGPLTQPGPKHLGKMLANVAKEEPVRRNEIRPQTGQPTKTTQCHHRGISLFVFKSYCCQ